jgi:hypothetical protein
MGSVREGQKWQQFNDLFVVKDISPRVFDPWADLEQFNEVNKGSVETPTR